MSGVSLLMNARQEAIARLGGCCAWCGRDQDLEIDHIAGGQGQGNAHRRAINEPIERWFKRQGWPVGIVQLLCRHCHDLKSGRIRTMPPRKGTEDVHISLPTDLIERLTVLASAPGMTRSKVIEAALVQHLEQGASETLLAGLHQRLDTLGQHIGEVTKAVQAFDVKVGGLTSRLEKLEHRFQSFTDAVNSLYDHEKADRNGQTKRSWFGR
jgi:metal-responsive CopG/Arc/MetJ family transcriptional regulator